MPGPRFTTTDRVFDADGILLFGVGEQIDEADARRLGLLDPGKVRDSQTPPEPVKPAAGRRKRPGEDRAVKPSEDRTV